MNARKSKRFAVIVAVFVVISMVVSGLTVFADTAKDVEQDASHLNEEVQETLNDGEETEDPMTSPQDDEDKEAVSDQGDDTEETKPDPETDLPNKEEEGSAQEEPAHEQEPGAVGTGDDDMVVQGESSIPEVKTARVTIEQPELEEVALGESNAEIIVVTNTEDGSAVYSGDDVKIDSVLEVAVSGLPESKIFTLHIGEEQHNVPVEGLTVRFPLTKDTEISLEEHLALVTLGARNTAKVTLSGNKTVGDVLTALEAQYPLLNSFGSIEITLKNTVRCIDYPSHSVSAGTGGLTGRESDWKTLFSKISSTGSLLFKSENSSTNCLDPSSSGVQTHYSNEAITLNTSNITATSTANFNGVINLSGMANTSYGKLDGTIEVANATLQYAPNQTVGGSITVLAGRLEGANLTMPNTTDIVAIGHPSHTRGATNNATFSNLNAFVLNKNGTNTKDITLTGTGSTFEMNGGINSGEATADILRINGGTNNKSLKAITKIVAGKTEVTGGENSDENFRSLNSTVKITGPNYTAENGAKVQAPTAIELSNGPVLIQGGFTGKRYSTSSDKVMITGATTVIVEGSGTEKGVLDEYGEIKATGKVTVDDGGEVKGEISTTHTSSTEEVVLITGTGKVTNPGKITASGANNANVLINGSSNVSGIVETNGGNAKLEGNATISSPGLVHTLNGTVDIQSSSVTIGWRAHARASDDITVTKGTISGTISSEGNVEVNIADGDGTTTGATFSALDGTVTVVKSPTDITRLEGKKVEVNATFLHNISSIAAFDGLDLNAITPDQTIKEVFAGGIISPVAAKTDSPSIGMLYVGADGQEIDKVTFELNGWKVGAMSFGGRDNSTKNANIEVKLDNMTIGEVAKPEMETGEYQTLAKENTTVIDRPVPMRSDDEGNYTDHHGNVYLGGNNGDSKTVTYSLDGPDEIIKGNLYGGLLDGASNKSVAKAIITTSKADAIQGTGGIFGGGRAGSVSLVEINVKTADVLQQKDAAIYGGGNGGNVGSLATVNIETDMDNNI